jgi:hypothetical protein
VSTLILSCKDRTQVDANLGGATLLLTEETLAQVAQAQRRLGVTAASPLRRLWRRARSLLGRS